MSQTARHTAPDPAAPVAVLVRTARSVTDAVDGALHEALERLERRLFATSDSGSSERFAARDALRALRRIRAELLPQVLAQLDGAAQAFATAGSSAAVASSGPWQLVDPADVAEAGLVASLAATLETQLHLPLYLLCQRVASLLQREAAAPRDLPIGPHALLDALRVACVRLDMAPDTRAELLRLFAHALGERLPARCDAANAMLAQAGVLPGLVSYRPLARACGSTSATAAVQGGAATPGNAADAPTPARSAHWFDLAPEVGDVRDDGGPEAEHTLFALMRHLLGGRRALACGTPPRTSTRTPRMVGGDELQRVLRELQAGAHGAAALSARLRPALQRYATEGEVATLAPVHDDTVDLVDLLFDHLGRNLPPRGAVAPLFARLQAPMLRAALHDAAFFTRRQHPARRLLDGLAEAGLYWLDADVRADDPLLATLRTLVDDVAATYDGDDGIFERAAADLQQQLAERMRRSAIIERRHVDAEKGRERLALARGRATEAVRCVLADGGLPTALRDFLAGTWVDVLALALLRDNETGFERWLQCAAELAACVRARVVRSEPAGDACDAAALATLRDAVADGLRALGRTDADTQAASVLGSAIDAALSLDTRPDTVVADARHADAAPPPSTDAAPDPATRQHLEQLRRLPFGTWFDVALDGQATRRCRMSWFSPVTGRCLFVNAGGQRAGDTTLPWLAAELAAGRAAIVREPQVSAIDSAWQAILGMLRSLGRDAPARRADMLPSPLSVV